MSILRGQRNEGLEDIYRHYNKKFFKGKLPSAIVVVLGWRQDSSRAKSRIGVSVELDDAEKKTTGAKWFIGLRPDILSLDTVCLMTLLHEMCHIAAGRHSGHGPRFQREMLRLAKLGAFKQLW